MKKVYFLVIGLFIIGTCIGQQNHVTSNYLVLEEDSLYYEVSGQGNEAIIFIHDGLIHSEVWDNQFFVFAEKFRVIRYDRRGYGRSSQPENAFSNIEDLNQVFTHLKIEKAILIGMSAGGGLAIDFTLKYPDKVSSLVVVGAVVGGFSYSEHFLTRGGRLTAADYADQENLLHYFVKEDPYEIAPQNIQVKDKVWALMEAYPHNLDLTRGRLSIPPDRLAIDILDEIKSPTFIVVGEYDIPDVFVHAGAIESGISSAEKVIIQGAAHLVPLEQPEAFNERILLFLTGAEFIQVLNTKGIEEAVRLFEERRKEDYNWLPFSEMKMNILGYQKLQTGKTKEAIELFKLNVIAYPESSNTYDSLAEAYMKNGDKDLAIKNYKKSLELDPENKNALEMLKRLE
jgi:pimeloyl-ACP methyl ester carboxylesterase